jgi:hypothetical protein
VAGRVKIEGPKAASFADLSRDRERRERGRDREG